MKKKRKAEMIHKKIKIFFLEGTQNEEERRSPRSLFYTEAVHFTEVYTYMCTNFVFIFEKRENNKI